MKVTLTFDNGPDPEVTPQVLDTLRAHDLQATFFVVGEKLRDPARHDLMRRAHAEGHWIGNHTFNHLVPLGRSSQPDISTREIKRTEALIGDCARPSKLFRPMGGGGVLDENLLDRPALNVLKAEAYTVVLWNAVPGDWRAPDGWVETALEQCRSQEHTLIVLHDLPTGAMAHLDRFLRGVADEGGTFEQEFPESTTPLVDGQVTGPIEKYVKAVQ